jgi:hypothetical protein
MANRPEFVCVWLGLAKIGQKYISFLCLHGQQIGVFLRLVRPRQNRSDICIFQQLCVFLASRPEFVCVK